MNKFTDAVIIYSEGWRGKIFLGIFRNIAIQKMIDSIDYFMLF